MLYCGTNHESASRVGSRGLGVDAKILPQFAPELGTFEPRLSKRFDLVVVGAGQAGIEAALAASRMGRNVLCVTLRLDRIGHLPCNCSIGGPAKGHIAREVDALGGQMGVTTDFTMTHMRRVGTGKGPAVQTFRAHVCKTLYPLMMREVLTQQPNLTLLEGSVEWIETAGGRVTGVKVKPNGSEIVEVIECSAVVVTTGTFLNGLCHEGQKKTVAARHGDVAVAGLSDFLRESGIRLRRFKTGTTPRIAKSSVDFSRMMTMESEPDCYAVSFLHDHSSPQHDLLPCWQTHTNEATHTYLTDNLHQSAMFSGQIQGVGPRYCPSVEDKVVRFADKTSHPIFLEQEEWASESMYVQGFSTSMPADVQELALKTIVGLENMVMMRPGYAVEYDMADPLQLDASLMSHCVHGLFLAGQLNGTSGYEEAAGQGIVAGINAARFVREEPPIYFPRDKSFIGVMIDDLVTKGVEDPYRMLTARAEHRLVLRNDNSDQRLTPTGRELGIVCDQRWSRFESKMADIESGMHWLHKNTVTPASNDIIVTLGAPALTNRISMFDLLKRPGLRLEHVEELADAMALDRVGIPASREAREQMELAAAYDGYIEVQQRQIEQASKLDSMVIPHGFDWKGLVSLSYESVEKLGRIMPNTVGQASRIPGVRPADIALIIGHLRALQNA